MKFLAIMQPYFFPYLGYFQLIHAVDQFLFYDNINYIYQGWVNRNRLLVVNQSPIYFGIPVPKKGLLKTKIKDIKIKNERWRKKILNSIYFNYKRSEYFEEIFYVLEKSIKHETNSLSILNKICIVNIASLLEIETQIITGATFEDLEEKLTIDQTYLLDAFPEIKLDIPDKKVIRAISICKALSADVFINPIGGVGLYSKEDFRRNNVKVSFLKMNNIKYHQNSLEFHPKLSIIDVLMNCGKERTSELLNKYTLI